MPARTRNPNRPPLLEICQRIAAETGRPIEQVMDDALLGVLLVAPDIQFLRDKPQVTVAECLTETVIVKSCD